MEPKNYYHFAEKHLLIPLLLDEGENLTCKACEKPISDPFHGCLSCKYFLHDHCINIPRSILHPSHSSHPLTLLPIPTYPSAAFTCNACGLVGNRFSYGCAFCEFDVHFNCAFLPGKIKLMGLHEHQLELIFGFVHEENNKDVIIFECDVCGGKVEDSVWRYYCEDCDFGVHLDCVDVENEDIGVNKGEGGGDEIDWKSGTATAADQRQLFDGTENDDIKDVLKTLKNEMMESQLGVAQLQHQMNLSSAYASVMRYY
ncbi:hypothetical protein M9H77_33709 [Catharanthus roseus]|uniref:Uncharacterized protein n=1 Tax=Catharanthus roseus TaxID=4058 RepID=A0ACB9ZJ77_CATRO|nr:hypothetical protein M9H77_33709 [Catharanthus roseus]